MPLQKAFEAEKGIISCAEGVINTSSTTIFLFLAKLLFLRKINRINLRYHFIKPSEIHRFAEQIIKL